MAEGTILIENARIVFRNFEGKEGPYNRAGDRNFCVLLDDDLAGQLLADGWNIKALRAREDDEPDLYSSFCRIQGSSTKDGDDWIHIQNQKRIG